MEYYPRAIECFEKVLTFEEDEHKFGYEGLGICYWKQGRYYEAIEMCSRVLKFEPDWDNIHYTIGEIYMTLEEYSKAKAAFTEAVRIDPHNPIYYYQLWYAEYESGDFQAAEIHIQKYLDFEPSARGYDAAGMVASALKKPQEAIKFFSKAIELNPEYPDYHYYRGKEFESLKLYKPAFEDYTALIEKSGQKDFAYFFRDRLAYLLEMYGQAIKDMNECIKLNPSEGGSHVIRGLAYYKESEPDYVQALIDLELGQALGEKLSEQMTAIVGHLKRTLGAK